jgi:uncharacterized RDD family membrane protein YckC
MQTINVQTTQNVALQYSLASLGSRILAFLLDLVILVLYTSGTIALFIDNELEIIWIWIVMLLGPILFYHFAFEIFMNGQSPGKRVMGIRVVRIDGAQPNIGDYFLRWLLGLLELYVFFGALALISIAAGGRGQRVGDIMAGTCVVKVGGQREAMIQQALSNSGKNYEPAFPQVIQLENRDIELIRRAIDANVQFDNIQPVLMVAEKLKSMLNIQTELPATEFLTRIVKDFNHFSSR